MDFSQPFNQWPWFKATTLPEICSGRVDFHGDKVLNNQDLANCSKGLIRSEFHGSSIGKLVDEQISVLLKGNCCGVETANEKIAQGTLRAKS
jgi:hypothetical protein